MRRRRYKALQQHARSEHSSSSNNKPSNPITSSTTLQLSLFKQKSNKPAIKMYTFAAIFTFAMAVSALTARDVESSQCGNTGKVSCCNPSTNSQAASGLLALAGLDSIAGGTCQQVPLDGKRFISQHRTLLTTHSARCSSIRCRCHLRWQPGLLLRGCQHQPERK